MTEATAILTGDIHIRPGKPQSRIDDFQTVMWEKWRFILDLSAENGLCPIFIAGDLGQDDQWPNWLLEKFLVSLGDTVKGRGDIFVVPGQHDLPNHNLEMLEKSALGVLGASGFIYILTDREFYYREEFILHPFPYGKKIENCGSYQKKKNGQYAVAISHQLVFESAPQGWEQGKGISGMRLLEQFPEYDLILTGDNHKPFVVEHEGNLLVNPGSMMRSSADQVSHRPRVYLWYADEGRVDPVYLPIKRNVLSREHIEQEKAREARMDAFVTSVKSGGEIKLSFEDNMTDHLRENSAPKRTEEKIWEAMRI